MSDQEKPKKTRKKRTTNNYFTKVHENAIIKYVSTSNIKERHTLYVDFIQPAFDEMVNKIVFTYKFNVLPNIAVLQEDCKLWLMTVLGKFDPAKASKAFSYFSVVTKNWFIHKVKKNSKSLRQEIQYEALMGECMDDNGEFKAGSHALSKFPNFMEANLVHNDFEQTRDKNEFWECFWEEVDSWEDELEFTENDEKVYQAIKILFDSVDSIDIFNKKAVYMYLREITNLNTKQIVMALNKMRGRYKGFRKDWDDAKY